MAYELFTVKKYKRQKGEPILTVKTNGDITFNTASLEPLKKISYIQILYDKRYRRLCLRKCQKNSPGAFKLVKSKNYTRLHAKTAFKQWNLFPKKDYRKPLVLENNEIIFSVPR